jgi:hypothetical protein
MSVVEFMQTNIFGDASAVLTRKLSRIEDEVIKRVVGYHDWICLRKSDSFILTTADEYEISGDESDLEKVVGMWYGDDKIPLVLLYDKNAFYEHFYNRYSGDPKCCLFLNKTAGYTWKVRVYPAQEGTVIYYDYQRKVTPNDTELFSSRLVFVDGILARYYAGKNESEGLSKDAFISHMAQLEEMRLGEMPVAFPEQKVTINEDYEDFLNQAESYRNLRKR